MQKYIKAFIFICDLYGVEVPSNNETTIRELPGIGSPEEIIQAARACLSGAIPGEWSLYGAKPSFAIIAKMVNAFRGAEKERQKAERVKALLAPAPKPKPKVESGYWETRLKIVWDNPDQYFGLWGPIALILKNVNLIDPETLDTAAITAAKANLAAEENNLPTWRVKSVGGLLEKISMVSSEKIAAEKSRIFVLETIQAAKDNGMNWETFENKFL